MTHDFRHGRGAISNPGNRFEPLEIVHDDGEPLDSHTVYLKDSTKNIIATNDSPDIGFSASINPYRGCEHGCTYCYARPTHEYLGFSAGRDFESKIMVKLDAPKLLRDELSKRSWKPQVIAMSGVTDCYQPVERQLKLTRGCLEVLCEFRNPVAIVTKSGLVTRDIDVLSELSRFNAAAVFVSLPTLDHGLSSLMEPRAARPSKRLDALKQLSDAGIPTGVLIAPIIPGLSEHEIPAILERARQAGATAAGHMILRLPLTVKPVFLDWAKFHFPDRYPKILHHIQSIREGKTNNAEFGKRMTGSGPYAEHIHKLFHTFEKRLGYHRGRLDLCTTEFLRNPRELSLF
jgi:DNA repair photolyase